MDIKQLHWPVARLAEGIEELARRAQLKPNTSESLVLPASAQENIAALTHWIDWASERLGVEAESINTAFSHFDQALSHAGPALMYFADGINTGFYLILKSNQNTLHLIGPDLKTHRCPSALLRTQMVEPYEATYADTIDQLLDTANIAPNRRAKARKLLMQERIGKQAIGRCWMLRTPPLASLWQQLVQSRIPHRLVWILSIFAMIYLLEISSWGLIGKVTLNGHLDLAWLTGWALLTLSLVPIQLINAWLNATFALDIGKVFKQRLLNSALNVNLKAVRNLGAGQLLGRVMESQALESMALNGGMGVLVGIIELILSAWVLSLGAGGAIHVWLLLAWILLTMSTTWVYCKRLQSWTYQRFEMTQQLVEKMLGHRTRLAQEPAHRRILQEDQSTQSYFDSAKSMDNAIVPVMGIAPSGWMMVGVLGLAPAFISGTANTATLAISLGGMLLANRALSGISAGVTGLARAGIAWSQVASLFTATIKKPSLQPFLNRSHLKRVKTEENKTKLIDAHNISFRYQAESSPVLNGAHLAIYQGERILLQGASGGGKSTLASLLVGLREQDTGLLLLNGLDKQTLGDGWQKLVTEAPQFHENHILNGTLAYNLLMGRTWPAPEEDIEEAKALCIELGLGDLIARMPAGMMQVVGETGWQLSHGERSRIFLARALLQNAELTILDESFAALDPNTLALCLDCAFKRANTLIVIAHP